MPEQSSATTGFPVGREAQRLIDSGYRPTSNRYRGLSRIDRPDWREVMAGDIGCGAPGGMEWVIGLRDGAADFYRTVLSEDSITVDQEIYDEIKRRLRDVGASHGWGQCNDYLPVIDP